MFTREKKLLSLLLCAALIFTTNTAVFAGSSPSTYTIKGWTVKRGSFSSKGIKQDMDKGIVNLTVPVESRTTTKSATMEGRFPDLSSVYVDVVDLEELTTEVEIYVSEAPNDYLSYMKYHSSSAEITVHTDGKAASRLNLKEYAKGTSGNYVRISDNSLEGNETKVDTEFGYINCTVTHPDDNLTIYKLDYVSTIPESLSKNKPFGTATKDHGFPKDVYITYNQMISAYAFYGVDKQNFRKALGDIEISRNGIKYVATDGKILKFKHHSEGDTWFEYALQIKNLERAYFDPSGAATLSGNTGLSEAEIIADKKFVKAIKKATKRRKDHFENPLPISIYPYQLTGNMGDGDYQFTLDSYDILDTFVAVKFNINGKKVKVVHGKKDKSGEEQLVAYYSNNRYFNVNSTFFSGTISMNGI